MPIKLSVVVTVYNEELNIKPLIEQFHCCLDGLSTRLLLCRRRFYRQYAFGELYSVQHPRLKVVEFRKNYQSLPPNYRYRAVLDGEFIATMDGDRRMTFRHPRMLLTGGRGQLRHGMGSG